MIAADVEFQKVANAAADQFRQPPAYISYHTVAKVDIPGLTHKVIERQVETRTADDFAVLQDLPKGQRQYGQSFPLIPTFDALSYFRIDYSVHQRNAIAHVTTYDPIWFAPPHPSRPGIAVVAMTLRNYYAHYADDSTDAQTHILMDPLKPLTQNNTSSFYIHDLYVDMSTDLPTQVTYTGPNDLSFTIDYTVVDSHWLVSHVVYSRSFSAPLHIGKTSFSADVTFDQFAFPDTPSDAKLATSPIGSIPVADTTGHKATGEPQ